MLNRVDCDQTAVQVWSWSNSAKCMTVQKLSIIWLGLNFYHKIFSVFGQICLANNEDQDQTASSRKGIPVICYSVCIFWWFYLMVKPLSSYLKSDSSIFFYLRML